MGETISADTCCTSDYDESQKEAAKKQTLMGHAKYENKMELESGNTPDEYIKETKVEAITVPLKSEQLPPWNINSIYHNKLTYMEMSQRYKQNYRKPPNFYDDCIRKLRSTRQRHQSTQKQAQYDSIIQNTSKSLLRTRTMLTASFEEQQQTSITNLIHQISENDEKFWFQPFLFNVIDSISSAFVKLIDSKRELVLNYTDFYKILTTLPVLNDVLAKDYPLHFHSQTQDRLQYLFDPNDITYIKRKQDIIDLLQKATKLNRSVCAVGYATSIASNNNNTIIDHDNKDNNEKKSSSTSEDPLIAAMIPNHLRSYTHDISIEYTDNLSAASIKDYELIYVRDIGNNKICIGGATPIWLYREWCHKRIECDKKILSEPSSVQSLYHSFVGAISISEHGGGYMTSTLSDYCIRIKVLNSEGIEIEYSNENDDDFKSLLPNLGLLGIVTEIELQFVDEYYCKLNVGVISIDKLFPKKNKGRTFSKVFEDIINSTRYNEFFWFPTTNQIYSLSLDHCIDNNAQSQLFPSKTWEKNWLILQREINVLNEILSIQLLNGKDNSFWTNKLATKLITKINVNLLNDLVIKLNLRPKMRGVSSPRLQKTMKLVSCDALHLFEFYPSHSNNNLFQNIEWLFPLNSKSHKKILINDHHVPNVELAAHLFMSAINCYNQNMLKHQFYPYQHALNLKVIKASHSNGISHCSTNDVHADFYCTVNMNVFNIEQNKIFQQFHKEFIQTCKYKVYGGVVVGIKPHWRNLQSFNFMEIGSTNNQNNYHDIYSFIKYQYKEKFDKLNETRYRDNKNPQIFEHEYLREILH